MAAARRNVIMSLLDKPSLLIVDDEQNFAESLLLAMEDQFTVTIVNNLENAQKEINRSIPSVVLLDLRLPDGDGMELLRELRSIGTPIVVVMTAYATVETYLSASCLGAEDYVAKPLNVYQLKYHLKNKLASL